MKLAIYACWLILLAYPGQAQPAPTSVATPSAATPPPAKTSSLPVIEINRSSPLQAPISDNSASKKTIELTPIQGQKTEKMTATGRSFWGGPFGMPAGPGRAWPNGTPPGTPGAPGGGIMSPAGMPSNF